MNDLEKLRIISNILKLRFNNLSVSEINDLAIKIIEGIRQEAKFSYMSKVFGSFTVYGTESDIQNLQSLLINKSHE